LQTIDETSLLLLARSFCMETCDEVKYQIDPVQKRWDNSLVWKEGVAWVHNFQDCVD
jgi:hypothetical protein